jgi:hypothetical protein
MNTKTPVEKRDYAVRWQHLVNGPIQCTPVRIRILNDFFEAENIYEAIVSSVTSKFSVAFSEVIILGIYKL